MAMEDASVQAAYDDVPYLGVPHRHSHPDRLAVLGRLFGVATPDVRACRVLEMGCATGRNLLPMAQELPGSTFVGVDFSAVQIEQGKSLQAEVGLKNVELRHGRAEELTPADGPFDYIIAHGIYSWVPMAVREGIMRAFGQLLSPQGVAYVDFNTYPGWHTRQALREMMMFHSRNQGTPREKVARARRLIDVLAPKGAKHETLYQAVVASELGPIIERPDWYVFHDYLEGFNQPLYFHEFVRQAGAEGLQYLSDTYLALMTPEGLLPEVQKELEEVAGDLLELEQYMDFARNRMFRQATLVRAEAALDRNVGSDRLAGLYASVALKSGPAEQELRGASAARFEFHDGTSVEATDPRVKIALATLGAAWPLGVRFEELCAAVVAALGTADPDMAGRTRRVVGTHLLELFARDTVQLHPRPLRCADAVGERPVASAFARVESREGDAVTNVAHERAGIDALAKRLLPLLDGTRDRAALVAAIADEARTFGVTESGMGRRKAVAELIEQGLEALRLSRLLIQSPE